MWVGGRTVGRWVWGGRARMGGCSRPAPRDMCVAAWLPVCCVCTALASSPRRACAHWPPSTRMPTLPVPVLCVLTGDGPAGRRRPWAAARGRARAHPRAGMAGRCRAQGGGKRVRTVARGWLCGRSVCTFGDGLRQSTRALLSDRCCFRRRPCWWPVGLACQCRPDCQPAAIPVHHWSCCKTLLPTTSGQRAACWHPVHAAGPQVRGEGNL